MGGKPDDRSQRWEDLRSGRVFRDATKTPGGARREDRGRRRGDYQVSPDVKQESRRPAGVQSVARVRRVRQRNRHGGLCKRHPRVAQVPQRAGQLGNPRRDGTSTFTGSQPRARGSRRPVVTRDWRKRRSGSTGCPRLDQRMGPRFPKYRNPRPTVRHRRGQLHEGTGGRLLHPRRGVRAPGCDFGERSGMRRV